MVPSHTEDCLAGTRLQPTSASERMLESDVFFAIFLFSCCKVGDVPVVLTESSSHWCFVAQFTLDAILPLFFLNAMTLKIPA